MFVYNGIDLLLLVPLLRATVECISCVAVVKTFGYALLLCSFRRCIEMEAVDENSFENLSKYQKVCIRKECPLEMRLIIIVFIVIICDIG